MDIAAGACFTDVFIITTCQSSVPIVSKGRYQHELLLTLRFTVKLRLTNSSLHGSAEQLQGLFSLSMENPNFYTPQGSKTPESIDIKLDRSDYAGDLSPHANFGISTPKGVGRAACA